MEENIRLHILNFLLSHKVCSPYCENEKGSIGILAGVSFAVLALLVAVAIDYSHIVKNHSELQYHSDHASLAAARFYGETNDKEQAIEFADEYLNDALLSRPWHKDVQVSVSVQQGNKLEVIAQSTTSHMMGGLIGRQTSPLSVLSEVTLSDPTTAEVAVVVDVTSSMIEQNRFFPQ